MKTSRLAYIPLIIWTIIILFPLYWVISTSFKLPIDVYEGANFLPWVDFQPSLDAWDQVLTGKQASFGGRIEIMRPLINSVIAATTSSILATLVGAMAAYGLARFRYRYGPLHNRHLSFLVIAQRMLPPAAILIAFFVLFDLIGLQDSLSGLVLFYFGVNLPLAIWLLHDFFATLPREMEEAALVDGTSWWGAFIRISIPLAAPGIAATFIILFIFSWNEYFFASMLAYREASTLPVLIAGQVTAIGVAWGPLSALTTIAIIPTVLIGLLASRYVVRGLTAGAVR
jgi:multiple sugar transport system permease protein